MPTFGVRIVCDPGPDPVDGRALEYDEETLAVEAPSRWEARSAAFQRMTLRPMGRLLRAYDAETGDEIVDPPQAELRPGRFVIDGLDGVYDGFTRGETWNGFAVPYFPLAEARRVAADYAAQPAGLDGQTSAEYDQNRDVIRLYDPCSDEWDEYWPVGIDAGTVHGLRGLYSVGARYWTWEEA